MTRELELSNGFINSGEHNYYDSLYFTIPYFIFLAVYLAVYLVSKYTIKNNILVSLSCFCMKLGLLFRLMQLCTVLIVHKTEIVKMTTDEVDAEHGELKVYLHETFALRSQVFYMIDFFANTAGILFALVYEECRYYNSISKKRSELKLPILNKC